MAVVHERLTCTSVLCLLLLLGLAACAPVPAVETSAVPTSTASITPPATPTAIPDTVLPHTLYYLADGQVFRMERDGKTKTQLTFEDSNVTDYDVSLADGSVAFVMKNQLLLINGEGSNRRLLVDGGPREESNPWVTDPAFSPDGQTLAYGHNGLNLYDLSAGISNLVIQNQQEYVGDSETILGESYETYVPERYSPDGTKLLVALGHWEAAPSHAVYYPKTNTLVRYSEVKEYNYCCSFYGGPVWSPDSSSFYGIASIHDSSYLYGELWRVDVGNGTATSLLRAEDGMLNLPKEPYLAPDGQFYFFLGTYSVDSGYWDAPVLNLVRSAPDGMTDRTVLRDENFRLMNEALWAPDASFVITATWPGLNWDRRGGVLELYYTDRRKAMVWLDRFGQGLKWGP